MSQQPIIIQVEEALSPIEFKDILIRSTLGERRPITEIERLEKMCLHANLIVTARKNGILIGVARSLSDFTFCTYLSDLAVDKDHQRTGIGRQLVQRTKEIAPKAKLILLAAPAARAYYPKVGMRQFEYCFML